MNIRRTALLACLLVLPAMFSAGCIDESVYQVDINVLYSKPVYVNNTTIFLGPDQIFQYKDLDVEITPTIVAQETIGLNKRDYRLKVIDTNYNLTKTKSIHVDKGLFIDIIISPDGIDIDQSHKPTGFK